MTGNPTSAGSRPLARPTLLPGLRRLWRSRWSLQLGVDPDRAVVLELPDPSAARLLDLLDGTRSERTVLTIASRWRIRPTDARALLDALRNAGLVVGAQTLLPHHLPDPVRRRLFGEAVALALRGTATATTPAEILRRRGAARVVVSGGGPLAGPVALTLAQAGVGHVSPALEPGWSGPDGGGAGGHSHASQEVVEAIVRVAPGTRTGPVRRRDATFVVQVGAALPANLAAAGYAWRRLAHLVAGVREGVAVVGPLVPPTGRPCLECLDLHRHDRDPAWPAVAAQMSATDSEPCAATTLLSAAALAANDVLRWLDGETPTTLGASVEVTAPGQLRRRSWPPHPGCRCARGRHRTAAAERGTPLPVAGGSRHLPPDRLPRRLPSAVAQ